MKYTLIILLIVILFLIGPWLVALVRGKYKNAMMVSMILSLVFVPVTLFVLNQSGLVPGEQTEIIVHSSGLRHIFQNEAEKNEWVHNNFIFIDDSYSNQLVMRPNSNQLGHSTLAITDRSELTTLFDLLHKHADLTDIIVCDIFLDIATEADTALQNLLVEPTIESRLVIAENPMHRNTGGFGALNDSVYGFISEKAVNEGTLFATYTPVVAGRQTMAYRIFRKMKQLSLEERWNGRLLKESSASRQNSYGLSCFIPVFAFTREEKLYDDGPAESEGKLSDINYIEIGDLRHKGMYDELIHLLQQRKKEGKKNIVFIGSFKGEDTDVHETYFGRLHGSTIILNLIYSLLDGQHHIPFLFLFYLWAGLSVVLYVLMRVSLREKLVSDAPEKHVSKNRPNRFLTFITVAWYSIILHNIHTWMLILFALVTYILWGKMINCFALIILFHLLAGIFSYYGHRHQQRTR